MPRRCIWLVAVLVASGAALIGSGGGTFKTDQHVVFEKRWLRDLHHTVMTRMFGMSGPDVDGFGMERADQPRTEVKEILAV